MINIIPKPYQLTDYDKSIIVSGFNYECPIELESGLEVLKEEFKKDRTKTQIIGFSKLNLLELTRKHICGN